MAKVVVKNNNVEAALRLLRKKTSDMLYEVREREYYTTPSEKRRLAKQAAVKRAKKKGKQV
jgi:ribosomal protein S21